MTANLLYQSCAGILGTEYPEGMLAIPRGGPVAGRGFFPVASGSFVSQDLEATVGRKILVVGHDWGAEDGLAILETQPDDDMKSQTASQLKGLLLRAGVALEDCFFTNALFGVRKGEESVGESPAWADAAFVKRCEAVLRAQIEAVDPEVVVCLGRDAPRLLTTVFPECRHWLKDVLTYRKIDAGGLALLTPLQPVRRVRRLVLLTHPSGRNRLLRYRSYGKLLKDEAEVALLRAALESQAP